MSDDLQNKHKAQGNEEWINSLLSFDETVLLYKTMKAEDLPVPEAISIVKDLLKVKLPERLAIASIVNAIFTQRTSAFMITKRDLDKLMMFDKNHDLNYLQSRTYKVIMDSLSGKFWEVREKPVGRKGGLYILKDEKIINVLKLVMIDESFDEIQTKRIKKYYELQNEKVQDYDPHAKIKEKYGIK